MRKIYTEPMLFALTFVASDVITLSVGLASGDVEDTGSIGNTKSVLGFEEF